MLDSIMGVTYKFDYVVIIGDSRTLSIDRLNKAAVSNNEIASVLLDIAHELQPHQLATQEAFAQVPNILPIFECSQYYLHRASDR